MFPGACVGILGVLLSGLLPLLPEPATAQEFPDRPVRLIVPFSPGGPNDLIARVIA